MGQRALIVSPGHDTGLQRLLADADWSVDEASNPLLAGTDYDLLVCPLRFDDGRDGLAVLRRLHEANPGARRLVTAEALLTGDAEKLSIAATDVPVIRVPATPEGVVLCLASAS